MTTRTTKKATDGAKAETAIDVMKIERGRLELYLLGTSPIIQNRLAEKARRQLLMPPPRKSRAAMLSLKHDPYEEFRASPYRLAAGDTLLGIPCAAFKKAIMTAALDIPGATRAQIGRLVVVNGDYAPLYGLPELRMDLVRQADISRTPDIRTRACLREWATRIVISYTIPLVTPQAVCNLVMAGGLTAGVGDWRPEKGAGSFGQYEVVMPDDERWHRVAETGGRASQIASLLAPVCYDDDTVTLLGWFDEELAARQKAGNVILPPAPAATEAALQ